MFRLYDANLKYYIFYDIFLGKALSYLHILNIIFFKQTSFKVNGVNYVQRACESLAICEAYKMNPNIDSSIRDRGVVTEIETSCCSDDLCNSEENINSVQSCYYCAYCSPLDRTTVPCGSTSDSCRVQFF